MTLASCSTTTTVFPVSRGLFEDADKACGVTRMESNAWFIEHEERVDEARAETGREVHALCLAAGERARRPVEREVAKADFNEVAESRLDFAQRERERIVWLRRMVRGEAVDERERVLNGEGVKVGQRQLRFTIYDFRFTSSTRVSRIPRKS